MRDDTGHRHEPDGARGSVFTHTQSRTGPGAPRAAAGGVAVALALALALPSGLGAQEDHGHHDHDHGHAGHHAGHHAGLHFTHPMIAESVTPDRKVRFDHQYFEFADGEQEHSGVLEAEYPLARFFSVEASFPYTWSEGEAGNLGVMLKFANFALEDAGLVLGYGVDVAAPTAGPAPEDDHGHEDGDEGDHAHELVRTRASAGAGAGGDGAVDPPGPTLHTGGTGVRTSLGSDEWQVGPFLNVGWKSGPVELVGWSVFQIPFDHHEQSEVGTELAWNVSGLYHVSSRVQALVELDGSGGISGPSVGEDVVNVSPGLRVQLLPDTPLVLGSSVGVPLANEEPFDVRWKTSLFWHFPR